MNVAAYNPETDDLEKTYVSSFTGKGATTLPVKNNSQFVNGRRILIGRMGGERSEIVTISSVATDKLSLGVGATKFDHNSDDPVYMLDWDQIKFYRATSKNGTYTVQQAIDIDVDNEDKVTVWNDTAALSTYYYQTTFYNSILAIETDASDPIAATGFGTVTIGNVIDQVIRRVRDTSYMVLGVSEYLDIANEVGSDLITQAHKPYRFLKRTVDLPTAATVNTIPFPGTMWKFDYVEVLTKSGNISRYTKITPMNFEEFQDRYNNNQTLPQDNILDVALDEANNQFVVYPTPKTVVTAALRVHYYKTFDQIDSVGDAVETPNTLIYRYKLMAEYYSAKSEADRQWYQLAAKYEAKYAAEIGKMQRVNRIDTGTVRAIAPPPGAYRRRRLHL